VCGAEIRTFLPDASTRSFHMPTLRSWLHAYRPFYRALTLGVAVTLFVVLVLQSLSVIHKSELTAYDSELGFRGHSGLPNAIAVVGLDAPTIQDLAGGRNPIPRHWYAQAITFLRSAGARAIGLDFLYTAPSGYGPQDDVALHNAMKHAGNVVLAGALGGADASNDVVGEVQYSPPYAPFERVAAAVGLANVPVDVDGEVRSAQLIQLGPGGGSFDNRPYYSLPLALAAVSLHTTPQALARGLPTTMLINYVGPQDPGDASKQSFHFYQLESVAKGEDSPSLFRNKIVLIIPAALVTKDVLNTPFGPMYGGFVQANTLNTILNRDPIMPIGALENSIVALILGLFTAFVAARFGIWKSAGAVLLLAVGFPFVAFAVLSATRTWVHVVTPEIALVLTFGAVMALRFATEERQKRRTAKIFGQYVKPEIVDILVNSPDEVAALAGVRREISILFVDIRGFTAMSELMDAEDVVSALDIYLEVLTASVLKFDGTINKYVGDEIVAVWNAPHVHDDHHLRAVRCGMDMVRSTDEINARLRAKNLPIIGFGVGINSGEVIVGEMGSPFRKQYDVIGDTVNTGARLCSAAGRSEVIISQSTWDNIADYVEVEETEPLRLKGKSQALRTFLVLDVHDTPNAPSRESESAVLVP
jgi:adenylate cyclase